MIKATWNDTVIAESDDTIVVEGNHYFPPEDVDFERLRASRMKSLCPWKGIASYYDIESESAENRHAAWTYRHPFPWIRKIRDRVAFWNGVRVEP